MQVVILLHGCLISQHILSNIWTLDRDKPSTRLCVRHVSENICARLIMLLSLRVVDVLFAFDVRNLCEVSVIRLYPLCLWYVSVCCKDIGKNELAVKLSSQRLNSITFCVLFCVPVYADLKKMAVSHTFSSKIQVILLCKNAVCYTQFIALDRHLFYSTVYLWKWFWFWNLKIGR